MEKRDIWFRRKDYGWGWTPATKEGWGVTLVFILMLVGLAFGLEDEMTFKDLQFRYFLPVIVLILAFIKVAYTHGEKPKFQWGNKSRKKLKKEDIWGLLRKK